MSWLSKKQGKIYEKIWSMPYSKTLKFDDVSKLLVALGCDRKRAGGANVSFQYGGEVWGMHPPHPNPEMKMPYIRALRVFLTDSGLKQLVEEGE